jgi:hypothetical protein
MRNLWATTLCVALVACSGKVSDSGDGNTDSPTDDAPTDDSPTDDAPTDDSPTDDSPTDDSPDEIDAGPTGDRHEADPRLIAGGGVADAPLAQVVHVHAIDGRSGAAIAGATVSLGALSATTGADGKTSFDDAALAGPLDVTVRAAGHASATWIGVDGANVTVPLHPDGAIPAAKVTGSFTLPNPPIGDYSVGVVLSTFTADISAAENQLPQPLDGETPKNIMVRSFVGNDTSFELATRTGRQRVYTIVMHGDTNGTNEDLTDDILTMDRVAVASGFELGAGQSQGAPAFSEILAADMSTLNVVFAAAPAGLAEIVAFPLIDLGADGKLVLPVPPLSPQLTSAKVPPATGMLAGSYEVVALATPAGEAATPFSTIVQRGVSRTATRTFTFSAPAGAAYVEAAFLRADGSTEWTAVVLAGTQIRLPAAISGNLELRVSASEVAGFDAKNFAVPTVKKTFTRASGAAAAVTP